MSDTIKLPLEAKTRQLEEIERLRAELESCSLVLEEFNDKNIDLTRKLTAAEAVVDAARGVPEMLKHAAGAYIDHIQART